VALHGERAGDVVEEEALRAQRRGLDVVHAEEGQRNAAFPAARAVQRRTRELAGSCVQQHEVRL
jgi:hypothetical protein